MSGRVFLDTNIFIYAYSIDDKRRQAIAQKIIDENKPNVVISTQVINEFAYVLHKKYKIHSDAVSSAVEEIIAISEVHCVDIATIRTALSIMKRHNYTFFDSLVLASAYENRCSTLYSEDMHNSHVIFSTVKITNPFVVA